jgi:hypothetical protein
MTRTISLIIGITATALTIGVAPALGEGRLAGSLEPAAQVAPDWFERTASTAIAKAESTPIVSERTPEAQPLVAERLRSEALNRKYGLGEFAATYRDAHERVVEPQSLVAERLRSEGLNRRHGLGEFGTASGYLDAHERAVPPVSSTPVSVTPTGSGRDVEWPQLGIGFAIGIALMLGLFFTMRATRGRELAH